MSDEGESGFHFDGGRGYISYASFYTENLDDIDDEDQLRAKLTDLENKLRAEATKLISALESQEHVRSKALKKLILGSLRETVNTYAQSERLPAVFVELAYRENCIKVLIKNFLKKVGRCELNTDLSERTHEVCESIYRNPKRDIVYDQVKIIQKFIHYRVDKQHGENACLRLPAEKMRRLLSTARLHLNIRGLNKLSAQELLEIFERSYESALNEKRNPEQVKVLWPKRFIPRWSSLHRMPLTQFQSLALNKKIMDILRLPIDLPLEVFQREVIRIYASSNHLIDILNIQRRWTV